MESSLTINLGVLSSALCGQRSLKATVKGRSKPRGKRLNYRTLEYHKTPDPREVYSSLGTPTVQTLVPLMLSKGKSGWGELGDWD